MIELYVTTDDINYKDRFVKNEYESNQTDWSIELAEAQKELIRDLKNIDLEIRRLGLRLTLESEVTKTAIFTGTKSGIDRIERLRFCLDCSAITGAFTFELQGTNDGSSETYTAIETITIDSPGMYSQFITKPYKYYRLNIIIAGTTVTYQAFMYETTYDDLMIYKALSIIYMNLHTINAEQVYVDKSVQFNDMYMNLFNNTKFHYDEDESGTIDEYEKDLSKRITFRP